MKVLHEKPPEWIMQGCLSQFRVDVNRTYWTYGDTIYNPGAIFVPDYVHAHEGKHSEQQEAYHYDGEDESLRGTEGKDGWWKRYLRDPRFRFEQEAEAYAAEYKFFCKTRKDRNMQARFLLTKSQQLSGPLYQVAVTELQARTMIEVLAGKKQLKV